MTWYKKIFSFVLPPVRLMQTLFQKPRQSHFQSPWGCDVGFSWIFTLVTGITGYWKCLAEFGLDPIHVSKWFHSPFPTCFSTSKWGVWKALGMYLEDTEFYRLRRCVLWHQRAVRTAKLQNHFVTLTMHNDNLMFETGNCAGKIALSRGGGTDLILAWLLCVVPLTPV